MKLGIFDSGIGGISVLNEAFHQLRDVDFVFYADVDHVPYGLKTPEEIKGYADRIRAELVRSALMKPQVPSSHRLEE